MNDKDRIRHLERALKNLIVMLPSDNPDADYDERIPAGFSYIRWGDLREARAVLYNEQQYWQNPFISHDS